MPRTAPLTLTARVEVDATGLSPAARVLRTLLQLAVALPVLVPAIVTVLHLVGVESVSEAGLLAVAAAALALVVAVQNFAEQAGLIPTVGAKPIEVTGTTRVGSAPLPSVDALVDAAERGLRIEQRAPREGWTDLSPDPDQAERCRRYGPRWFEDGIEFRAVVYR